MKITKKRILKILWESLILTTVTCITKKNVLWKTCFMPILEKYKKEIYYFVTLTYPYFAITVKIIAFVSVMTTVGVVTTEIFFESIFPLGFRSTHVLTQPEEAFDTWKNIIDKIATTEPLKIDDSIDIEKCKLDRYCSATAEENKLKKPYEFPVVGALIFFGSIAWASVWAFSK